MRNPKVLISGKLLVRFKKVNDGYYVSCDALKLSTFGETKEEGKLMFEDALNGWFDTVTKENILEKTLKELGFKIVKKQIPVGFRFNIEYSTKPTVDLQPKNDFESWDFEHKLSSLPQVFA